MSGGSFAVPTAVGIGGVSGINTQFESYGTQLTFTPTIIDKDRIRLTVSAFLERGRQGHRRATASPAPPAGL